MRALEHRRISVALVRSHMLVDIMLSVAFNLPCLECEEVFSFAHLYETIGSCCRTAYSCQRSPAKRGYAITLDSAQYLSLAVQ